MTARILCVEDNPQNMRLVRKLLKRKYTVLEAEDGLTGLRIAEEEIPDLILMDINLPDIDGTEVTRRIKAQTHLNHIPIIALTANAMYGDEEKYLAAGCDGYIAKPVMRDKLYREIERFLALDNQDESTA
ncbi:MAG: response regulator [Phototrophicaceae bacterium]